MSDLCNRIRLGYSHISAVMVEFPTRLDGGGQAIDHGRARPNASDEVDDFKVAGIERRAGDPEKIYGSLEPRDSTRRNCNRCTRPSIGTWRLVHVLEMDAWWETGKDPEQLLVSDSVAGDCDGAAELRDRILEATNDAGLMKRSARKVTQVLAPYSDCPRAPLWVARRIIHLPSNAGLV